MLAERFAEFLEHYPELALYLAVACGYLIGAAKIRGFSLGPVTGSLIAGILISQFARIEIAEVTRSIFFLLFLFGIGYSVGPQFLGALRRQGATTALLGIIMPVTGLLTAYAMARLNGFDPGFAAGLVSGGLTESTVIGTATDAIRHLPIAPEQRDVLISHIIVADAVCYLFGAFGVIWMCGNLGPWLLRIDLKAEAEKLEAAMGFMHDKPNIVHVRRKFELRGYRVPADSQIVGLTVREAEALVPIGRPIIQRIRRGAAILEAGLVVRIAAGDVISVAGRRDAIVEVVGRSKLEEVDDVELLDVEAATLDIMLSGKGLTGRPLGELSKTRDEELRGVYLTRLSRSSPDGRQTIPLAPDLQLQRGDIISLVGPEALLDRLASRLGAAIRPTDATDYIVLGLAIFLGGLFGAMIIIPVGTMHIALSTSVGTLLAGLVVGHIHASRPTFGRIPDAVVAMMTSFGLAAFVAMIGLRAGPVFFAALQREGLGIFFSGMVVTMTPLFVGLFVGRYVLRINPILLLGALAGAQTMTAGLAAVEQKSGSPIAVIGYTAAAPFGHILLTISGTVIVWLMA
jgi:putative transport protein